MLKVGLRKPSTASSNVVRSFSVIAEFGPAAKSDGIIGGA